MLTDRLLLCADFVRGDTACDVGTDHGCLAAELLLSGRCARVIASDINEKPLASARSTLEKKGLLDRADIILSDGLKNIPLDGVTDIIIAGMGGELIFSILSEADSLKGINLILQPMTKAEYLRKNLAENGFLIKAEKAADEGKHIYTVINAEYDGVKRVPDELFICTGELDPIDRDSAAYLYEKSRRLWTEGVSLIKAEKIDAGKDKLRLRQMIVEKIAAANESRKWKRVGKYRVSDILAEMDKIAPLANTEKGDNSGLLAGDGDMPVTKALTALDITRDVVLEAEKKGANVIVSHHPVIYYPLYSLNESDPACLAFRKGIACLCFHSPLDMADGGINDIIYGMLREPLGLSEREAVLEPVHPDGRGYGMVCGVSGYFSPAAMAEKLKEIFGCRAVRYTNGRRPIKKLAFCSGGGGSLLDAAIKLGADAYITGDVKHDRMIAALNAGVSVFDCGHYHTEVIAMEYLKRRFNKDMPGLCFEIAESCADPACYAL